MSGVIVFSTTVKDQHGDYTWTRGNDLEKELQAPSCQIVSLRFESEDDSRVSEFTSINLDEVPATEPGSAAPASEHRKPQVAGATD